MIKTLLLLSFFCVLNVQSQENAARYIARSLMECYNTTANFDREQRPPADINVLIALIRKIESDTSVQNDRMLSTEIIHRFKQDGITRSLFSNLSSFAIPYSPRGFQADKHRIYLTKLVPGSAVLFPNETLTANERCSVHFMVSNSIDITHRGDESLVCKKLNRYQIRTKRSSDPNNDVEILNEIKPSALRNNLEEESNQEAVSNDHNTETFDVDSLDPSGKQTVTVPISECPIENGVVFSKWGSFQAGTVIAGIAAGRAPQVIEVDSLNINGEKQLWRFNNKYAATLAGDLSEVALRQGSSGKSNVYTGNRGDWNSRLMPRSYYLEKYIHLEMTDAEIRGGLDGLIIASKVEAWKSRSTSLKISQILDMYYSNRGIFSSKHYRSCNRRMLFNEVVNSTLLTEQTTAFSFLLNKQSSLDGSLMDEGITNYSKKAVEHFMGYITTMNDFACDNSDSKLVRANTDIVIVLDTKWSYHVVQPALSHLLNNIDITKYDSNFTIINGKDGTILVENSNSILDFYAQYNRTKHSQSQNGFDASVAFQTIQKIWNQKTDINRIIKKSALQSSIVLFMPFESLSSSDQQIAESYKNTFKTSFPDLKLLVLGQNSKQTHGSLVFDVGSDAFDLPDTNDTTQISQAVSSAVSRIQQEPRRIVNYACSEGSSEGQNTISFEQYVDPRGINYHRIAPNYFFSEGSRSIKIRNAGYGNLIACMSRKMVDDNLNLTDADCKPLVSVSVAEFTLPNSCNSDIGSCAPVYITVKSGEIGDESLNARCIENACRFPDNLKYSIEITNLDCMLYNGGNMLTVNSILLLPMMYILKFIL